MSADNGFIIRRNEGDVFVLQEYFASAEALPEINAKGALRYKRLEDAVLAYSRLAKVDIVEYGLSVDVERVTINPPETVEVQARNIVFRYVKERLGLGASRTFGTFAEDEVYLVSFTENSAGWVALVSTSLPDGNIYEVVHLGKKQQTVLTVYMKCETVTFDD